MSRIRTYKPWKSYTDMKSAQHIVHRYGAIYPEYIELCAII